MTRRWVRCVVQGLVGVLLFAQMAIAAYACPGRSPAAAGTPQMATATVHTVQMANCDDMAGAIDAASATLCAEHCKYGQQSDQAPTLNVPVAVLTALYATPPVAEGSADAARCGGLVECVGCGFPAAHRPALRLPHLILQTTLR